MKLKLIPLLLTFSMLAACLAGCGNAAPKVQVSDGPAAQETPAPSSAPDETPLPDESPDPEAEARAAKYRAAYEKYPADKVVMLFGDDPVTWAEYFSWIYDVATQLEDRLDITDWAEPRSELAAYTAEATPNSYVRSYALSFVAQLVAIEQKAREMNVTLSQAQQDELDARIDGYVQYVGDRAAFEKLLADSFIPEDYFYKQNEAMILINNLYAQQYGADGELLPDEDAVRYVKDYGYMYAKHILFKTVDDQRNPLSDEEIAEKKAEAESVLAELRACTPEELPQRFDSLMKQYSEDPGMLSYPDGYYFLTGSMVAPFEDAVKALEENGLSDLVETNYGYHIIFCPEMRADQMMDYSSSGSPYTVRMFASTELFDNITAEWFTDAQRAALFVDGIDQLDLNELFAE